MGATAYTTLLFFLHVALATATLVLAHELGNKGIHRWLVLWIAVCFLGQLLSVVFISHEMVDKVRDLCESGLIEYYFE